MNRDAFLLNCREFVGVCDDLHAGIAALANSLRGKCDLAGKTYVSFVPLLALMQRQLFSAFDHLASFQAYQAWVMVRPAVEIPLIMGKWIDDPTCYKIWEKRESDPKPYQKEYSGKHMRSDALPRSGQIQTILKRLNDQFLHPNPFYYHRHLHVSAIGNGATSIKVEYFDEQETIEAHVLAFLHLIGIIHDSVREMLSNLVGTIPGSVGIACLIEERFGDRARELADSDPVSKRLLCDLGCWPEIE
jgi:hypothetical protein